MSSITDWVDTQNNTLPTNFLCNNALLVKWALSCPAHSVSRGGARRGGGGGEGSPEGHGRIKIRGQREQHAENHRVTHRVNDCFALFALSHSAPAWTSPLARGLPALMPATPSPTAISIRLDYTTYARARTLLTHTHTHIYIHNKQHKQNSTHIISVETGKNRIA